MLRSPFTVFAQHRGTTAAMIFGLGAALWLVAATASGAVQLESAADGWWQQFSPAVYVDKPADGSSTRKLVAEISEWSEVGAVDVEGREEQFSALEEHLGPDEIGRLRVDESMMPTRIVVEPRLWRPGEVELVARIEALEVREEVVGIDAPGAGALAWMERARIAVGGVLIVVVIIAVVALIVLASWLRRLQQREWRENHLLEVFGASPTALRMATLWRGTVLGGAGGLVAAIGFLPWALVVDKLVVDLAGTGAMPAVRAALWAGGLVVVGLVAGAGVGWGCSRPSSDGRKQRADALLDWYGDST